MTKSFLVLLFISLLVGSTLSCAAGKYRVNLSTSECKNCPAGFYCTGGDALPVGCAAGTASSTGASSSANCASCSSGKYCPGASAAIDCPNGQYQNQGGQTYCKEIPMGYRQNGAGGVLQCGAKQYRSLTNYVCAASSNIQYADNAAGQAVRTCPKGYSLDANQLTCALCGANKICDGTSTIKTCTSGQSSAPGASSSCITFPTKYAYSGNNVNTLKLCGAGQYYNGGSCAPCPSGKSCEDPLANPSDCSTDSYSESGHDYCVKCPLGYDCPNRGTPVVLGGGQYTSAHG